MKNDQNWPKVLITTSRDPAQETRIFTKLLQHILPNSDILNRGNQSIEDIHNLSMKKLCDFVYFVYSKQNKVDRLAIFKIYSDKLVEEPQQLKIYQYIDHKIFGFKSLPESGPLSTSLETRQINPILLDFFEKYFFIEFGKKLPLWLVIDENRERDTTFVAFIDALTQKKFFYAEVELVELNYE